MPSIPKGQYGREDAGSFREHLSAGNIQQQTTAMPYSICLRGFEPTEETTIGDAVRSSGHRLVRTLDLADIVVAGPNAERKLYRTTSERGLRLTTWEQLSNELNGEPLPSRRPETGKGILPLHEWTEDGIRILDQYLPIPGNATNHGIHAAAGAFAHICFDQSFAETLRAVCIGVAHDLPVALEGETGTAKTSAVQFLATLLGKTLIRFNLNGQTDAGELVGRFVPANPLDGIGEAELLEQHPDLSKVSREILERAREQRRRLTLVEQLTMASRDGFPATNWRFREGALPQAMRHGCWILLDELNLAEPQVLERLNPALENPRTLVLTEGDGTSFGPAGDVPVDPGFRIFATLNPSEYAGRNVLSPAFRDRWSIWHHASSPSESDYLAMIRLLVLGEHPVVTVQGQRYQAPHAAPLFPAIGSMEGCECILRRMAVFHASLAKAACGTGGSAGLGRNRRERYTFTRRTLLSLLRMTEHLISSRQQNPETAIREAIGLFYTSRIKDPSDRAAVESVLRASGFQP